MNPKISVAIDRSIGPAFYSLHRFVLAKTGGRLMDKAMGLPMVLLTTKRRRTAGTHAVALLSYPASESSFVVVPSNGGRDRTPDWFLNLQADPSVQLLANRTTHNATARVASAEEKAALFPAMTEKYAGWQHYETLTDREIPFVVIDL